MPGVRARSHEERLARLHKQLAKDVWLLVQGKLTAIELRQMEQSWEDDAAVAPAEVLPIVRSLLWAATLVMVSDKNIARVLTSAYLKELSLFCHPRLSSNLIFTHLKIISSPPLKSMPN